MFRFLFFQNVTCMAKPNLNSVILDFIGRQKQQYDLQKGKVPIDYKTFEYHWINWFCVHGIVMLPGHGFPSSI